MNTNEYNKKYKINTQNNLEVSIWGKKRVKKIDKHKVFICSSHCCLRENFAFSCK